MLSLNSQPSLSHLPKDWDYRQELPLRVLAVFKPARVLLRLPNTMYVLRSNLGLVAEGMNTYQALPAPFL